MIGEAPKHTFNANLFKHGVNLAISAEEQQKEEQKLKDLAAFLKKDAIDHLLQELKNKEGVPLDSASLEDVFHRNGVNMRYLGTAIEKLKESCKREENASLQTIF